VVLVANLYLPELLLSAAVVVVGLVRLSLVAQAEALGVPTQPLMARVWGSMVLMVVSLMAVEVDRLVLAKTEGLMVAPALAVQ
jgi:hypothetical protein